MALIPVLESQGMTVEQGLICKCNRCGHRWLPQTKKLPKRCAKCKSEWWNREKMKTGPKAGRPKGSKTSKPSRNAKRR